MDGEKCGRKESRIRNRIMIRRERHLGSCS